ncbi:hypothetical protein TNCV_3451421 [Trichonephila clavipes]|nr:hypothetical protein TNCV_3451421 [Trichonephila clavipes]
MSAPLPIVEAHGCRVMSLSLVSLKTRRVEELMFVKSAGTQTASRWCGVEPKLKTERQCWIKINEKSFPERSWGNYSRVAVDNHTISNQSSIDDIPLSPLCAFSSWKKELTFDRYSKRWMSSVCLVL